MDDLKQFLRKCLISIDRNKGFSCCKNFKISTQANLDYGVFSKDKFDPTNIRQQPAWKRNIIEHCADQRKSLIRFLLDTIY